MLLAALAAVPALAAPVELPAGQGGAWQPAAGGATHCAPAPDLLASTTTGPQLNATAACVAMMGPCAFGAAAADNATTPCAQTPLWPLQAPLRVNQSVNTESVALGGAKVPGWAERACTFSSCCSPARLFLACGYRGKAIDTRRFSCIWAYFFFRAWLLWQHDSRALALTRH